jgi:hypothetical protein
VDISGVKKKWDEILNEYFQQQVIKSLILKDDRKEGKQR